MHDHLFKDDGTGSGNCKHCGSKQTEVIAGATVFHPDGMIEIGVEISAEEAIVTLKKKKQHRH